MTTATRNGDPDLRQDDAGRQVAVHGDVQAPAGVTGREPASSPRVRGGQRRRRGPRRSGGSVEHHRPGGRGSTSWRRGCAARGGEYVQRGQSCREGGTVRLDGPPLLGTGGIGRAGAARRPCAGLDGWRSDFHAREGAPDHGGGTMRLCGVQKTSQSLASPAPHALIAPSSIAIPTCSHVFPRRPAHRPRRANCRSQPDLARDRCNQCPRAQYPTRLTPRRWSGACSRR